MQTYNNPKPSEWPALCKRPVANAAELDTLAKEVFARVEAEGDGALRVYTEKFDKVRLDDITLAPKQLRAWARRTPPALRVAIDMAYQNITAFHQAQTIDILRETVETRPGVLCWREARAIDRVGLYVPGGTAPLVSTALMLGVPAQLAGCTQIVLATPPNVDGSVMPAICYVALKIGATSLVRVGGMQAIAALTFGTTSVPAVDKLFGPGNQYVMAAKQFATKFGVAIDMPAGPSEVLIVADARANPAFVAADLLSQAEHGPDSQVVLVTTELSMAALVRTELDRQVATLPRRAIAEASLANSFCVVFETLTEVLAFANTYAAEHVIVSTAKPSEAVSKIMNAGSVFLGDYSPESAGDYASGTNHTLPTNGWARSYGGVSLDSFTKKVTFQKLTKSGLATLASTIETLAQAEGLEAHARAVSIRLGRNDKAGTNSSAPLLYNGEQL